MKKALLITLSFVWISCSDLTDSMNIYKIDPNVKPFVDRFFNEAAVRGKKLEKINLIVVVTDNINDPLLAGAAGRTTIYDQGGQRYIYLWSGAFTWFLDQGDSAGAERLVFHEMGHAFYRNHVDYKSIMNPNCPSDVYRDSDSLRTAFLNELMLRIRTED
jgi:hypothetical protein